MRTLVIGVMCSAVLNIAAATATPESMTVDRFIAICNAADVQAATVQGAKLGWRRLADAEKDEWRNHFIGYNAGSVEMVGWRREHAGQPDLLSFWVAIGPNGHKACAYSTAKPAGLLDALSARLGRPGALDKEDAIKMISAYWKRGAVEYSFTQIGSYAAISLGPSR